PTERWDTAFDGDTSASQGSHIFSGEQQLCCLADGGFLRRIGLWHGNLLRYDTGPFGAGAILITVLPSRRGFPFRRGVASATRSSGSWCETTCSNGRRLLSITRTAASESSSAMPSAPMKVAFLATSWVAGLNGTWPSSPASPTSRKRPSPSRKYWTPSVQAAALPTQP